MPDVILRPTTDEDLAVLFEHQRDPVAVAMAAFTAPDPDDRAAYFARWSGIIAEGEVVFRTATLAGVVVGSVLSYDGDLGPEVSYWFGREYWGRGIASAALGVFLEEMTRRPAFARVAKDNLGSIRVLEKVGFTTIGEDSGFANGRGEDVAEWIMTLA